MSSEPTTFSHGNLTYQVWRDGENIIYRCRGGSRCDIVGEVEIPAPLLSDMTQIAVRLGRDALAEYQARTSREERERQLAQRLREAEREIRLELDLLPAADQIGDA